MECIVTTSDGIVFSVQSLARSSSARSSSLTRGELSWMVSARSVRVSASEAMIEMGGRLRAFGCCDMVGVLGSAPPRRASWGLVGSAPSPGEKKRTRG